MHMRLPCFPVLLLNCALSAVFQHHNNNSPAWLSTVCSGALVSVVTAEWCHIIQRGGGARLCCREHSMVRHRYFCTIKVSVSFVILKSPHMHTHCQWYSLLKSLYIMIEKSNENITETFETAHSNTYRNLHNFCNMQIILNQSILQTNEHTESRHTDRSKIFSSTIDLHLQITKQTKTFDMSPVVKS